MRRVLLGCVMLSLLGGCLGDETDSGARVEPFLDADGGGNRSVPDPSFHVSEKYDRATVQAVRVDDGWPTWDEFELLLNRTGGWAINTDAAAVANSTTYQTLANPDEFLAGEYIAFCLDGPSGGLEATLRHAETGTTIQAFRFASVAAC